MHIPLQLVFVAVALVLLPTATATAKPPAKDCRSLTGRDLAPDPTVKLVVTRRRYSTDLVSCAAPRGPLKTLASRTKDVTSGDDFKVLQVAGRFLLLLRESGDQYGSSSGTSVIRMGTGRSYSVAALTHDLGQPPEDDFGATAATAFLAPGGRAVAAVLNPTSTELSILAFSPRGESRVLDSATPQDIPAESLSLNAFTAAWTHGGESRSASLLDG